MFKYTKSIAEKPSRSILFQVFKYAVKYHYPELSDLVAPRTASLSLDSMRAILQDEPDILFSWVCPCLGYLVLLNVQQTFFLEDSISRILFRAHVIHVRP